MTVPIIPGSPPPDEPTYATFMPPPPPPKRPGWVLPLIAGLAIVLVAVAGVAVYAFMRPAATAGPTTPTDRVPAPAQPATTTPTRTYSTPDVRHFGLIVRVLRQQCFGSAGCNVTYRVEIQNYLGPSLEPGKTWNVTYRLTGGNDPAIGTLRITGVSDTQYTYQAREELIQTPSSSSVLDATVTSVSPG